MPPTAMARRISPMTLARTCASRKLGTATPPDGDDRDNDDRFDQRSLVCGSLLCIDAPPKMWGEKGSAYSPRVCFLQVNDQAEPSHNSDPVNSPLLLRVI
jgi:hypothetical protein